MPLVDSSVWIDFFRGDESIAVDRLVGLLQARLAVAGDLIMVEVLQGFRTDRDFDIALKYLEDAGVGLCDPELAVRAARNYRKLRALGITPRKTIDTIIATWCIEHDIALLYSDRDFDPFVAHLGLRSALDEPL